MSYVRLEISFTDGSNLIIASMRQLLESKMAEFVTLECGCSSNRHYEAYFLAKGSEADVSALVNDVNHDNVSIDDVEFYSCCEEDHFSHYVLTHISSHDKVAIDKTFDGLIALPNNPQVTWIKINKKITTEENNAMNFCRFIFAHQPQQNN